MIQLSGWLWGLAIAFAVIGYRRGLGKELISLSGVILALFTLFNFDKLIRGNLLATSPATTKFYVQAFIFIGIVYFAYQTRRLDRKETGSSRNDGRDQMQTTILGALVGFLNGYMIAGSIWYFMHINNYPLAPYISAPPVGSPSYQTINSLPLYMLAGGPTGDGTVLSFAVIVLFIIVLVII